MSRGRQGYLKDDLAKMIRVVECLHNHTFSVLQSRRLKTDLAGILTTFVVGKMSNVNSCYHLNPIKSLKELQRFALWFSRMEPNVMDLRSTLCQSYVMDDEEDDIVIKHISTPIHIRPDSPRILRMERPFMGAIMDQYLLRYMVGEPLIDLTDSDDEVDVEDHNTEDAFDRDLNMAIGLSMLTIDEPREEVQHEPQHEPQEEDVVKGMECKICLTSKVDTALTVCGHVFCGKCVDRLYGKCAICRKEFTVQHRLKLYF